MPEALDAALFVISVVAVAGSAALAAAAFRFDSIVSFALAAYLLAVAFVVVATEILSVAGAVGAAGYVAFEAVALAGAGAAWGLRGRPRPPVPAIVVSVAVRRHRILAALAVLVSLALAYELFLVLATPPNNGDALKYHLPRAASWLQAGAIQLREVGHVTRGVEFQPNGEILILYTFAFLHGDAAASLPQFLAKLALVTATVGCARRLGYSRAASLFAALVFATLTQVALQSVTAKNDLVVASFIVAAVYFLRSSDPKGLAFAGVAVGLALGTKLTAVLALPVLALIALVSLPRRRLLHAAAAMGLGFALLGAYSFVENVRVGSGALGPDPRENIFKPEVTARGTVSTVARISYHLVDLSGYRVRTRWLEPFQRLGESTFDALGIPANPPESTGFPFTFTINVLADVDHSFFGPLGFLLVVPLSCVFLVAWAARRTSAAAGVHALALPLYAIAIALTFRFSDEARFLIPAVALTIPLAGAVYRIRPLAAGIAVVAAVTLVFAHAYDVAKPTGLAGTTAVWTLSRAEEQGLTLAGMPELIAGVDRTVPEHARVGTVVTGSDWIFPLYGPRLERRLVPLPPGRAFELAERRGLRWVFFGKFVRRPTATARWTPVVTSPAGRLYERLAAL